MDPAAYYSQQGGPPQAAAYATAAAQQQRAYPLQQGYVLPGVPAQYQPIRLARFPGEALHGQPASGMLPIYAAPPGPPYQAGMALGGPQSLQPQLVPMGIRPGVLPPPYLMQQGQYQALAGLPHTQQPGYCSMPASGLATPTRTQSPSATPAHLTPHHRVHSGPTAVAYQQQQQAQAQLAAAHQQQQVFQAQPVPGPPGVNLPESLLSPSSPGALRQQGLPPSPGRRGPPASQQLVPLGRGASTQQGQQGQQGGLVDLTSMGSSRPAASVPKLIGGGSNRGSRAGSAQSAQSLAASVRGLGAGKPPRLGSGGGGWHASAPASRAGSAGKKSTAGDAGLDEFDNIKVAVRMRPPNMQELARADQQALFVNPNDYRQIQLAVPRANGSVVARNFTFHACLGPTSRQADVVRLCGITQLLDAALDGFNTTIMAFGQTGSGKTYTMSGHEDVIMDDSYQGDSDDGIMARSAVYLFEQMHRRNDGCKYSFRVSYLEIYNEAVYDLLKFDKQQLQVRWDAIKGFHVPELYVKECTTLEELLKAISRGMRHRRVGSHELNLESSRSHSIMTIYCDCTPLRPDDHEFGTKRYGKVSLVDLAGSERVRDSKSSGGTLKETTNINRSLFMLGKVISSLAEGAQGASVPYRESKLTKLLMDSLGGSSLSLIIACCSPSAAHVEETLSTLTYASRAKNIRNQPIQQVDPQEAAISALKREVRLLRAENAYLQEQLFQANMPRGQPASRLPSNQAEGPGQALPSGRATPFAAPLVLSATTDAALGGPGESAGGTAVLAAGGRASRPASAGTALAAVVAAAAAAGTVPLFAAQAHSVTSEELLRRLLEAQRMLVQFSRENGRLAGENDRLRAGKSLVATDYQGALEEVEWLRAKLESLETSLLRASLDVGQATGGLSHGGVSNAAEVLKEAWAAVEAADGADADVAGPEPAAAAAAAGEGAVAAEGALRPADAGVGEQLRAEGPEGHKMAAEAAEEAAAGDDNSLPDAPAAAAVAGGPLGAGRRGPGAQGAEAQGPLGAGAAGQGTKPPLIAPELLADPSELRAAGGAQQEQAQAPRAGRGSASGAGAPAAAAAEPGAGGDEGGDDEEGWGSGDYGEGALEGIVDGVEGGPAAASAGLEVEGDAGIGEGPGLPGVTAFALLAAAPPKGGGAVGKLALAGPQRAAAMDADTGNGAAASSKEDGQQLCDAQWNAREH